MKTTDKKENKENMKTKTFEEKTFEEKLEELKRFCEENNRLPNRKVESENDLCNFYFYKMRSKNPEIMKLREKYSRRLPYTIEDLRKFCEENKRMPASDKNGEIGLYLYYKKHKTEPEFMELRKKYGFIPAQHSLSELRKFCEENGRMPSGRKSECTLYKFYIRHKILLRSGVMSEQK